MSTDQGFILSLFSEATHRKDFQHKWMSSDTWAALINKYYVFDNTLAFNGKDLLASINSKKQRHLQAQLDLRSSVPKDHIGIFREKHRFHGGSSYTWFFYATDKGQCPDKTEKKWHETINDANDLLNKVITRNEAIETKNTTKVILNLHPFTPPSKKRKILTPVRLRTSETLAPENKSPNGLSCSSVVHHCPSTTTAPTFSYWDSPEARKLFRVEEDEDTQQSIRLQIEVLMKANASDTSYLELIHGSHTMDDTTLSNFEKHMIRQKSQLLCMSLNLALENMNGWTWNKCCREAIETGKKMGMSVATNPKTIEKWYRNFRETRAFCIPLRTKLTYHLF